MFIHGWKLAFYYFFSGIFCTLCPKKRSKCKGKGLDTCYGATYMSQTRDQQRFTISEVAADWHERKKVVHQTHGDNFVGS